MKVLQGTTPAILLFTADPELERLGDALEEQGFFVCRVATVAEARALLETQRGSCVAVLDTTPTAPYSVDAVYRLLHQAPAVPTLLLFPRENLQVERVTSSDDYAHVCSPTDLLVLRVCGLLRRAGMPLPHTLAPTAASPGGVRFQQGQSIVVFGPKGGVGRSTIAVNLAVAFAQLYHRQVALVDADLWSGDVAVLLDVRQRQSISSLAETADFLDVDTVQSALVQHPSGVHVLRAPVQLGAVEKVPEHLPARLVSLCRALFDVVVVDTPTTPDEHVLQLFESADRIVLVTTPELSALRSTHRILELAPTFGWDDNLLLVLNRANSGVPLQSVEETMGRRVDISIVSAGQQLVGTANIGQPILLADPTGREQVTRDLGRLAAQVLGEPEPEWEWKSAIWRRALGRLGNHRSATQRPAAPVPVGESQPTERRGTVTSKVLVNPG